MGIIWTHLELVWNPSGPSDVTYFTHQQLVRNYFLRFLQQTGSNAQNSLTNFEYQENKMTGNGNHM